MTSHRKFATFSPATKIAYVDGRPKTIHLRRCRLTVHHAQGPAAERSFDQPSISVGAMDDNDLTVPEETVSRYHCKITQEDTAYILKDLGSTNGTTIQGVRIREAYLPQDCDIYLGNCRLHFHAFDEEVVIQASHAERCGDIIGRNVRMREIFGMIEKIAPTGATVVIEGETGTGKEVVAQTIHKLSTRRKKPFIVLDCGAVPESLIESELFGHEKGSFTGAIMTRQGLFEMAQSGTIFLDELGELSLDLQPKLLRVLEQREVRRVGSNKPIPIDVRVIAATNRDLEAEVKAGRFREDLFYRLSVVRVLLPPLRERKEDISLLVHHFLREHRYNRDRDDQLKIRHIAPQALRALEAYRWPGNIRELVNVIERACSFAEGDTIELRDLPEGVLMAAGALLPQPAPRVAAAAPLLEEAHDFPTLPPGMITPARLQEKAFKEAKEEWISAFERDYIVALLERNQHNISHAAREAEIDRKYFRKLMKKYGIEGGADAGED